MAFFNVPLESMLKREFCVVPFKSESPKVMVKPASEVRCGEMKKVRIDGQVFVHHQGGTGLDVIGGQVAVGGGSGSRRCAVAAGVDCLDGEEIGRSIGKSRNGVG